MSLTDGLLLGLVTFVGAAAQGATGFGFAILVISFYLAIVNSTSAVQLTIALSLTVSLALLPRLWRQARRGLLLRLSLGSALGFPFGLAAYALMDLAALKLAVAVLIIFFAGYLLMLRPAAPTAGGWTGHPAADVGVGVVSGFFTISLGIPGPPVILYLAAIGAGKEVSRATILTLFCLSYTGAMALQAVAVGVPVEIWQAILPLVPVAVLGAFAGHRIAGHLSETVFRRAVLAILIAAGAYTLVTAVLG